MLRIFSKTAIAVLALGLLALPALAQQHPGVGVVDDAVARIVMNDLLKFYPAGEFTPGAGHLHTGEVCVCVHPSTSREEMEAILRRLPTWEGEEGERYYRLARWTNTAMDGGTGNYGHPINLTYSFIPDGTYIPGGAGEPSGASILYSRMDALFGDTATWKQMFAEAFGMWSQYVGITYTEVGDDGASFPNSPGILGSRGDVRIGSHYIDGYYNVLAYDYFPDQGDMVLDSAENWANSYQDYRTFRNVVMHEHGHGHGLGHPTPNNHTKLMEAYLNTNFLGPQEDDIRGGGRNYGDPWEKYGDDDPSGATDLGDFQGTVELEGHFLHGSYDSDFFAFQVPVTSSLDVILDPLGSAQYLGYEGGSSPVLVNTDEIMDMQFTIWKDVAGTPTEIANFNDTGYGENESVTDFSLDPGDYYIEIHKSQGSDVQRYMLTLDIFYEDLTAVEGGAPQTGLALSAYPNPFNPKTTLRFMAPEAGQYQAQVFDSRGRRVRDLGGHAAEAGWVEMEWNGRDEAGRALPSGIYFLRVSSGGFTETIRGVLLK